MAANGSCLQWISIIDSFLGSLLLNVLLRPHDSLLALTVFVCLVFSVFSENRKQNCENKLMKEIKLAIEFYFH